MSTYPFKSMLLDDRESGFILLVLLKLFSLDEACFVVLKGEWFHMLILADTILGS